MVRARVRGHLEAIQRRLPDLLGGVEIQALPATDYAFRLFTAKETWTAVAAALVEEIAHDNFKSEVAREQGRAGAAYEAALHEVWEVIYGLQEGR